MRFRFQLSRIALILVAVFLVANVWRGLLDWTAFRKAPTLDSAYQSLVHYSTDAGWELSDLLPGSHIDYRWRSLGWLRLFSPSLEHVASCWVYREQKRFWIGFCGDGRIAEALVLGHVEEEDVLWMRKALPTTVVKADISTIWELY